MYDVFPRKLNRNSNQNPESKLGAQILILNPEPETYHRTLSLSLDPKLQDLTIHKGPLIASSVAPGVIIFEPGLRSECWYLKKRS